MREYSAQDLSINFDTRASFKTLFLMLFHFETLGTVKRFLLLTSFLNFSSFFTNLAIRIFASCPLLLRFANLFKHFGSLSPFVICKKKKKKWEI